MSNRNAIIDLFSARVAPPPRRGAALPAPAEALPYQFCEIVGVPSVSALDPAASEYTRREAARSALAFLVALCVNQQDPFGVDEVPGLEIVNKWKSLIGTLFCTTFSSAAIVDEPQIRASVRSAPLALMDDLYALERMMVAYSAQHAAEAAPRGFVVPADAQFVAATNRLIVELNLPPPSTYAGLDLRLAGDVGTTLSRAAYLALMSFVCGKPVETGIPASFIRRVSNLQDKRFRKQEVVELGGALRPCAGGLARVSYAWSADGALRMAFFAPLTYLVGQALDEVRDTVATTISMTAASQMAGGKIITDFYRRYECLERMRTVAQEFSHYRESVRLWQEYPAEESPFAKALRRDQFKLFDGKTLARLTRLAAYVLGQETRHYQDYALAQPAPEVLEEFTRLVNADLIAEGSEFRYGPGGFVLRAAAAAIAPAIAGPAPPQPLPQAAPAPQAGGVIPALAAGPAAAIVGAAAAPVAGFPVPAVAPIVPQPAAPAVVAPPAFAPPP